MHKPIALVVIDVQCAAFDGRLCPPIANADRLLERVAALQDAARAAGVQVLHVQHLDAAGQAFAEGSPGGEIHPKVAPRGMEAVLRKRESSAFDDTPLQSLLDETGVSRIVACGLQSEHCVSNTSLGALARGYSVLLAHDAHSTWPNDTATAEQIVERQNRMLEGQGARLMSCDELVAMFREMA